MRNAVSEEKEGLPPRLPAQHTSTGCCTFWRTYRTLPFPANLRKPPTLVWFSSRSPILRNFRVEQHEKQLKQVGAQSFI